MEGQGAVIQERLPSGSKALLKVWGFTQTVTGLGRAKRPHNPGMSELLNTKISILNLRSSWAKGLKSLCPSRALIYLLLEV